MFHSYSIWLFTCSDLKTIVGPKTLFGILSAYQAQIFNLPVSPSFGTILASTPIVALWTWINLLPFAIDNQRQPAAIMEDRLNKPWRPLPSRRMKPAEAKVLMLLFYPAASGISFWIGGIRQCLFLIVLGYWYNDCKGADTSWVSRNFINASGFLCYTSGAMEVALGRPLAMEPTLLRWFLVIGIIVFSTVQTQDMYDQAGDSLRGRQTLPLVLGEWSRWTVAIPMVFWCWFIPWYWNLGWVGYPAPVMLGNSVAYRTLLKRNTKDDKLTFRIWNIWLVTLYASPLWNIASRPK